MLVRMYGISKRGLKALASGGASRWRTADCISKRGLKGDKDG
ncbi:hypothetical protein P186_0949 [Pyrobaculum ferrireducens]|uniref:Uncharacterized protein n=1 Tax=Pyrobaculum ferrireducens TaxID=1104324 RepID=G7VBG0_9CREN|nr:hypothetical protein P186_0949 [Pyrobaculum ferrireducens]